MDYPIYSEFQALALRGNLIPVYREIDADLETPVSIYLKLRKDTRHTSGESFLLESVEGGEQLARYSFIATDPARVFTLHGDHITVRDGSNSETFSLNGRDPLDALRQFVEPYQAVPVSGLPRFFGGAVGFLSYDLVRHIEHLPNTARDELDLPEAVFFLTDTLIAFDHVKHRLLIIANAHVDGDPSAAYDHAIARIDCIAARLKELLLVAPPAPGHNGHHLESNIAPSEFAERVRRGQEHIAAGDIFQVVLSQRFSRETDAEAFAIYRALRRLNPSPYMFFLDFGDTQFIGSSPEILVRFEEGIAQLNPIAGTRPRGADDAADAQLEEELRHDSKERAEHVMLVDLGRNDLGRVCEYGSVQVQDYMSIEKFSHVMHLVSRVVGRLRREFDVFDLLRATFPAGTVSGAPKVRAMEIIEELEGIRRGPYAGAVGYFGFPVAGKNNRRTSSRAQPEQANEQDERARGNMDFCITIRTIVLRGRRAFIQAGAGIVADSDPNREHQECVNKAQALAQAIRIAEGL